MTNKREQILHAISNLSRQLFGNGSIGRVFLYGSQARKDAGPQSDWDLLIITDDSASTSDGFIKYAFPFAEIGWRFDAQITPIHYSHSQWEAQRDTSFYQNVTTEAIQL